jgi:hypothetical protein
LSPGIRALIRRAGVIGAEELRKIAQAPSLLGQRARTLDLSAYDLPIKQALAEMRAFLPDLSKQLFQGVHGIHLAGGVLHAGTAKAGILMSIKTAELAVDAIGGQLRPYDGSLPLHDWLHEWAMSWQPALPAFDQIASIRPLRVDSASRLWTRLSREPLPIGASAHFDGPSIRQPSPVLHDLLGLADGTTSLGQIAAANRLRKRRQRDALTAFLVNLWRTGVLTWLPPSSKPSSR